MLATSTLIQIATTTHSTVHVQVFPNKRHTNNIWNEFTDNENCTYLPTARLTVTPKAIKCISSSIQGAVYEHNQNPSMVTLVE
jgi:hypothetical protein